MSEFPPITLSSLAAPQGGVRPDRNFPRETFKTSPTWRGVDGRREYILAELADVDVEYRLASQEADGHIAVWTRCSGCQAPMPAQADICPECGFHRRAGRRVALHADSTIAPPMSKSSRWLATVERIVQRVLPRRRALCVRDRAFSDQDLRRLVRLWRYRSLDFEGTQLTDEVVDCLARLRRLEFLIVRGTRISPDGVAYLRGRLKNCEVID